MKIMTRWHLHPRHVLILMLQSIKGLVSETVIPYWTFYLLNIRLLIHFIWDNVILYCTREYLLFDIGLCEIGLEICLWGMPKVRNMGKYSLFSSSPDKQRSEHCLSPPILIQSTAYMPCRKSCISLFHCNFCISALPCIKNLCIIYVITVKLLFSFQNIETKTFETFWKGLKLV